MPAGLEGTPRLSLACRGRPLCRPVDVWPHSGCARRTTGGHRDPPLQWVGPRLRSPTHRTDLALRGIYQCARREAPCQGTQDALVVPCLVVWYPLPGGRGKPRPFGCPAEGALCKHGGNVRRSRLTVRCVAKCRRRPPFGVRLPEASPPGALKRSTPHHPSP